MFGPTAPTARSQGPLDGEPALRPALVVLDLMLPELDGRAVIRAVRRDDEAGATPIIILSARGAENDKVRAELVYFETDHGGGVFSTGSITWAASLSHDSYQNNVARITGNVLRRFLDPEPLAASLPT